MLLIARVGRKNLFLVLELQKIAFGFRVMIGIAKQQRGNVFKCNKILMADTL